MPNHDFVRELSEEILDFALNIVLFRRISGLVRV